YISTPQSPLGAGGRWVSWSMTNGQNSLAGLVGNSAYLIHSSGIGNYSWNIQGQPVPPHYAWDLTGLNLVGFSTPPANPPNFGNYFAQDPAIASIVQVFQYPGGPFSTQQPSLNPAPVILFNSTPVNRGQGYWVGASNVNNVYFGPFQLNLANPAGVMYGSTGGQTTFHLVNITPNALTVSLSVVPSETPPYGQTSIVSAPPLMLEGAQNPSNLTYAYTPINGSPTSWTLPPYGQPGSDLAVVLGVNRFAMSGANGTLYAGILQFTDSLGFSQLNVPVSATVSDNTGLWVGKANVSQVSYDLKTYATNSSGSYVSTVVTNQVVALTTNSAATLGMTTNLFIADGITSNVLTGFYTVTNQFIDAYLSNGISITSNGFDITTNLVVDLGYTTNIDITTTVTGYYFTNNGELLVWETTSTTNEFVDVATPTTNEVIVTNQIALVPADGTPVAATNLLYFNYTVQTQIITNAIFSAPVTNVTVASTYSVTNFLVTTNPAYNGLATNLTTDVSITTNAPTVTNYSATTNIVFGVLTTNSFPAPYLYVFTNPPNLVAVSVLTNAYSVTNSIFLSYITNSLVINRIYTITNNATNLTGIATNVIFASTSTAPPTPTVAGSTNISLVFTTNALVVAATNTLVSSVSNYVISAHNTSLDSVVAPYPLRLIVFNGSNGTCSLLQRVYYGLRQNTNIVVATTESVLDASHLNVARRITATHLPWASTNVPWTFAGGPLAQGGTYTTTVTEQYDDQASNPFLHTYHPDHNNLDTELTPRELPIGSESYQIDRAITLSLFANTNDFISLTSANSALSGVYNETISLHGLAGYTKTYQTAGSFSLQRISTISTLTTQ
ncbi:MAG TPA: hypothetical protein VFC44_14255, partial [Candidatus Saccharimonadales bacterium]|nr:hypothetical protein [Candidatus Saccharimonadales bacterium]